MAAGKVRWFNDEKRFGFITFSNGSDDVFGHLSAMVNQGNYRKLSSKGRAVMLNTESGAEGPHAARLVPA